MDHHKGLHPRCHQDEQVGQEGERLVLLSQGSGAEDMQEGEGEAGEAGTLRVTLWKHQISSFMTFLLFLFSKNVSIWHQSFLYFCFSFSVHVRKAAENSQEYLERFCQTNSLFSATAASRSSSIT